MKVELKVRADGALTPIYAITQPTQRVISKNFAMGVVKTAIIAPINAAISSNVIKKFSEVSAVNLTDAKKASVTNSNATNNNYFMKVPKC